MKLNYNEFLAVVYGDIFDWPMTISEVRMWAVYSREARRGGGKVGRQGEYVFLPGREKLAKIRREREKFSGTKREIATRTVDLLRRIPTVVGIFLTGSVAVGNAKKGSDIDLMVVAKPGTLWLTRVAVFTLLKSLKLLRSPKDYRDKVCPNIFLDGDHLKIREKNLYTAHEVLQAKCLFDRDDIERKWLEKNGWTKKYLPNVYKFQIANCKLQINRKSRSFKKNWNLFGSWYLIFEAFAFVGQYLYMRSKMTNERVGWGYAFFHPQDLSESVLRKFSERRGGV